MWTVTNASTASIFCDQAMIKKKNQKKKEHFQTNVRFFESRLNKNENLKVKTRQLKFQPYQIPMKKRTKDQKSQTGAWLTDINHQGKVSLFS